MKGFVVVGTDTDAGKTTFSLLFLGAFPDSFAYWKPVETGDSDTEKVRRLVPNATVLDPLARFIEPVAPALAAQRAGRPMPGVKEILAATPSSNRPLLVETFGSPLSPLTDDVLQIELIREFRCPVVLVASSVVGAVGRTLQAVQAMEGHGLKPAAIVLVGPDDAYASEQIARHAGGVPVAGLTAPVGVWEVETVRQAVAGQRERLGDVLELVGRFAMAAEAAGPFPLPLRDRGARVALPKERSPLAERAGLGGVEVQEEEPLAERAGYFESHSRGGGRKAFGRIAGDRDQDLNLLDRDRAVIWHPYSSLQTPGSPLPVVAAEDEYLILADGRKVIDGVSSWWTILHGHRQPAVMQAIRDATHALDHVLFAGATHPHAVQLADRLLQAMPWPAGGRVFYSDNGSTAVEVAIKMAYQFWCHRDRPNRTLFIGFANGYHGDTFGAMSVGRDPLFFGRFEPLLFRALQVPVSADALDAALTRHRDEVAAVIIEPLVQGAGGMQMHTAEELRAIFDVTRRHQVLFIADEVMTGFGRTGSLWAFEQAGIAPDLITLAKGITGGVLPLSATVVSPEVVSAFDTSERAKTFFHGHSFTANPLACAAAVASWDLLQTGRWQADVRRIETYWKGRTHELLALPGVKGVRGRGMIAAVELDVPGGYLADVAATLLRTCLDSGVLLRPLGNVLYAMPPLCTSDESLARIADVMSRAIRNASSL